MYLSSFLQGPVKFSAEGRNIAKPMLVTQVLNGQIQVVAPDEFRKADMIYPIPYGSDNNSNNSGCVSFTIATFTAHICARVTFENCQSILHFTINDIDITTTNSIGEFKNVFKPEETCQRPT